MKFLNVLKCENYLNSSLISKGNYPLLHVQINLGFLIKKILKNLFNLYSAFSNE